jgi:hypothetical protein
MEEKGGPKPTSTAERLKTMERFTELRERVRSGHYDVPARAVAEAILRHMIDPGARLARGWPDASSREGVQ